MLKKPVYVMKMLKMSSKFWHHVKSGLEQDFMFFLGKITLRNPFRWFLNRFSKFWHCLKSLVIAKVGCSYNENINLRQLMGPICIRNLSMSLKCWRCSANFDTMWKLVWSKIFMFNMRNRHFKKLFFTEKWL